MSTNKPTAYSKGPSKVPSVQPLRSTDQQAVLQWAQSVTSAFALFAGQAGDPLERRISVRDLANLGQVNISYGGGGANGVTLGLPGGAFVVLSIEQFAKEIRDTQVFKSLRTSLNNPARFDGLGIPPQVLAQLQQDLGDQAALLGGAISQQQTILNDTQQSLAMQAEQLTAALNDAQAGVRRVVYAFTDANGAVAGQITTIVARLDNAAGTGVTIEEAFTAQDLFNGLVGGQYTLKIDVNGHVAGFGLANTDPGDGNATSAFIVQADKFAIVSASDTTADPLNPPAGSIPFGVDTTGGTSRIYMNGQVLINAGGDTLDSIGQYKMLGTFSTAPSTTGLKKNNLYLNSTDGKTYKLDADNGTWQVYLQSGANGARGSRTLYISGDSWSDSAATAAVLAATGTANVIGDTVTISNSSFAGTKYWSGSAWVDPGVIINGNLLVTGTVSGSVINGGTIGGTTIEVGPASYLPSSSGHKAFYMDNGSHTASFDSVNTGGLAVSNDGTSGTDEALIATAIQSSGGSFTGGHAIRGRHPLSTSTSGLVGAANGYDFYADGGGTNYGPFTGAHDALVPKGWTSEIGDIVVDQECIARAGVSNTIFRVDVVEEASRPGYVLALAPQPLSADMPPAAMTAAYTGIDPMGRPHWNQPPMEGFDALAEVYDRIAMNALGEGQLNVCGRGGDIAAGDFITTSTLAGKGQRQNLADGTADDMKRRYTVARAREACTFTSPDEVHMIACIYEGG